MTLPLFVFGTLRDDALRAAVAGSPLPGEPAWLSGYRAGVALAQDGAAQPFPVLEADPGGEAEGLLLWPDSDQRARLDLYELLFRYDAKQVTVRLDGVEREAIVYLSQEDSWRAGAPWNLEAWAKVWGPLRRGAAAEIMALAKDFPLGTLMERYGMIETFVTSKLRAGSDGGPSALRRAASAGDVVSEERLRPYARFFGVQEDVLRYRKFDGQMSESLRRAGFAMGDAVTVLPWDPHRDLVLLTEQFRYGPYLRGDPNPWSLETVAGRIDAGETPEVAGRREALEEAGLEIGALYEVGRYYPSPGAVSEYLYSYVEIADFGSSAAGEAWTGGLVAEGENIRSHLVSLAQIETMLAGGDIQTGPLLVSLYWLLREAPRLRQLHQA